MKNVKDSPRSNTLSPNDNLRDRRRLSSHTLFGTQNEIVIVHNEEEYRLRITSNGKLILTK